MSGQLRDQSVERAQLAQLGLPTAFIDGVIARLDAHGPTIEPRNLDLTIAEIAEEALDIAAWGIVARHQDGVGAIGDTLDRATMIAAHIHGIVTKEQT